MKDGQVVKRQPHPKQIEALVRIEFEVLYGGARGGGKTDCGMVKPLYFVDNPKFRCLVIRKNYDDLVDWISRAREMYSDMGVNIVGGKEITFPSGATIRLGHLKDENAYTKYQGHEYHMVIIEELTQIPTEELYLKLISSCRSTVDGLSPQVFCTTNPGEIGHAWVKRRFIDVALPGEVYHDNTTNRDRIFIPSRIEDNPTLMAKDPTYITFLDGLPSDLRKAWREGSWDVYDTKGSFYSSYIMEARKENRVGFYPFEKGVDVYKIRDLGIDDNMVVICAQFVHGEIRIIDCLYGTDGSLAHYIDLLKEKGYGIKNCYFPHDIKVREQTNDDGTGVAKTRKDYLEGIGVEVFITPDHELADGINAAKIIFNKLFFNTKNPGVEKLIEALNIYRKKRDEKNLMFGKPIHDWSSDFADALRYLAINYTEIVRIKRQPLRDLGSTVRSPITGQAVNNINPRDVFFKKFNIKP